VEVNPTSGSSTGEHDTITVDIDTTGLSEGSHTCGISISSNGGSGTFTVTVNVVPWDDVTLILYVHEGSASGPVLSRAQVTGQDGAGNSFDKTTGTSGYVTITGTPGTWQFTASKSGYQTSTWTQSTTTTCTRHAFLVKDDVTITIRVKRSTHGDGQVETLDLENQYLPVVVSCENHNAPYESMKAQAIAARTFAMYKKNHPQSEDFDVYDDERDQVYNPAVTVTNQHRQSVTDTNKVVLEYTGD
jgi:hypothetical protein